MINEAKVLAILTKTWGSSPQKAGAKMLIWKNGFSGTLGGGNLEMEIMNSARKLLKDESLSTDVREFNLSADLAQCCGGKVQVYFEKQLPKPRVLLFGAGHVGQELSSILAGTNIELHVVDERSEWTEKLAPDTQKHLTSPVEFLEKLSQGFADIALVMTHSHDLDEKLVEFLCASEDIKHIGLIGSDTKWRRFKYRLGTKNISDERLNKVQSPVGVFKGSNHPREIAISISAQILKWVEELSRD